MANIQNSRFWTILKSTLFSRIEMEKSIYTRDYKLFLKLLREVREESGLTQAQLAEALSETQSFISKCERGERRLDVIELINFCKVFGIDLSDFVERLEKELNDTRRRSSNIEQE